MLKQDTSSKVAPRLSTAYFRWHLASSFSHLYTNVSSSELGNSIMGLQTSQALCITAYHHSPLGSQTRPLTFCDWSPRTTWGRSICEPVVLPGPAARCKGATAHPQQSPKSPTVWDHTSSLPAPQATVSIIFMSVILCTYLRNCLEFPFYLLLVFCCSVFAWMVKIIYTHAYICIYVVCI